jgi:hypothetical protein
MVPVVTLHVGWVTLTEGAAGIGFAFIVNEVVAEVQPEVFLLVKL